MVFFKGQDVTPKPLCDPFLLFGIEAPKVTQSKEIILKENDLPDEKGAFGTLEVPIVEDDLLQNIVKPGLETPKNMAKPIGEDAFKILLRETKTFQLLCIDSMYREKGDRHSRGRLKFRHEMERDEGQGDEKSEHHQIIVETTTHETQTIKSLLRDASTMTTPVITEDSSTFVSNWDLYCSSFDKKPVPQIGKKSKLWSKFDKIIHPTVEEQINTTVELRQFKHACIIIERLLSSNNYSKKQAKFLKNLDTDLQDKSSKFHYIMEELWAFSCVSTANRTVTAMSWNPIIEGTLAVGYGSMDFCDSTGGLVCMWSVLNPCQPEHMYKFEQSVNDVNFSKDQPELLAAACHDGSIWIIHATLGTKMAIKSNSVCHLGPVWKVEWVTRDGLITEEEVLISAGNDGQICCWDICDQFSCSLLLHMRYGPEKQVKPSTVNNPVKGNHYLSGLTLTLDPKDHNMYLVGTAQGFLVKDIFTAHQGPVYSVQFSPFCPRIILTCGGDWTMCLWIEDLAEPILIIRTAMEAVMRAVWSPVHSTIIVSISGNELALWDFTQKVIYPMTVAYISKEAVFTTVEFTHGGNNVIAGDNDGNIHVYNLQEMPFIPYHQEKFLISSLKKYLKSKPKLLAELEKMELTT